MTIYTYSDMALGTSPTTIEAESIMAADVLASAAGLSPMKCVVSIGVRLIIIDQSLQSAPSLLYVGKLVNDYYYQQPTFTSLIFNDKKSLLMAYAQELKAWKYNPAVQLFWEYPTMHTNRLRARIRRVEVATQEK